MFHPASTYRVQFNKDFTFADLEAIIPYLKQLGISAIYASPIFKAVKDSTHGYDTTDPHTINPEIGTDEDLKRISKKLKGNGLGWIQDIVPNHMAFCSENEWLMDVLEHGQMSEYTNFFDCSINSDFFSGKFMVPFLGKPWDDVLASKELQLDWNADLLCFKYYDQFFPLQPSSYSSVFEIYKADIPRSVEELLGQLPSSEQKELYSQQWHEFRLQLAAIRKDSQTLDYLNNSIAAVNSSIEKLNSIAEEQYYTLCHWRNTENNINYRRFFTINGLICLNIQHKEVFDVFHKKIFRLLEEDIFQGLRIDHIDGLFDPTQYLIRLRDAIGTKPYLIVEKILQPGENIPSYWPVQGTTGYDLIFAANNVFTNKKGKNKLTKLYNSLLNQEVSVKRELLEKKRYVLRAHMAGELSNLTNYFINILPDTDNIKGSRSRIEEAIAEFLVHCPVYRYYGNALPFDKEESKVIANTLELVLKNHPELEEAITLFKNTLLDTEDECVLYFYQRCMQFTGPLMAKGVEDTLMYTYDRFVGHNEVGDSPVLYGISADEFHRIMINKSEHWPYTLNATATHDTKHGEDARARLDVLTDLAEEWADATKEWRKLNAELKTGEFPDANDEYFIYQSLIGAYPIHGDETEFISRFKEYLQKAFREAKVHTNWETPDKAYEQAVMNFTDGLFDKEREFYKQLRFFLHRIVDFGYIYSLAQLVLKFTCPGIPDTYRGTELWDFSFVDPDNRRPVDYNIRQQWLDETGHMQDWLSSLWEERHNGKIKLRLTQMLLHLRNDLTDVFTNGLYIPLSIKGKYKDNVLAFARRHGRDWCIVAVPLRLAEVCEKQNRNITEIDWEDTSIVLPDSAPNEWMHILNNTKGKCNDELFLSEVFKILPFAVLKLNNMINERSAGILLHISSLPSEFEIGDLGTGTRQFADFLARSGQKYWQLLPLNPISKEGSYSPYSSISGMAGNTLLISLDMLAEKGLLDKTELQKHHSTSKDKVDYEKAEELNEQFLQIAYNNSLSDNFSKAAFDEFCRAEAYWLDDFALFVAIKEEYNRTAWYEWDNQLKKRDKNALDEFARQKSDIINRVKWRQYIFFDQWHQLRLYCNSQGIRLIGDIPFYVNYDSADVWSNPGLFCMDGDGNLTGVAGVPPDYFSNDGQLWGMPTYNWPALKQQNYNWWVQRLKKNLELFDLVRIDHFRAFAEYWQVQPGETTARNGEWIHGPSVEFFNTIKNELGQLPLIAEDLGDNMQRVYELRDTIGLPGMKVLQFAFDNYNPASVDAPHNYKANCLVYPGTHDNNTTRGWYNGLDKKNRKKIEQYAGCKIDEECIHDVFIRMAYASVAKTVVVPMQDILGLDEKSRMNTPGTIKHNWIWRLEEQPDKKIEKMLSKYTELYYRK